MKSPSRITTSTMAARIPYANAAPFYALWADAPFAVRNLVPRDLGREAEAGRVDLGLMAAADYLRLKPRFELLGRFGVATRGPVQSVLLYSRRPASALANALISVAPETSTSIRLLRLLLDVRRGLEGVRYVRGLEPAQADAHARPATRWVHPHARSRLRLAGVDRARVCLCGVGGACRPAGRGEGRPARFPRGLPDRRARHAARDRPPADRARLDPRTN